MKNWLFSIILGAGLVWAVNSSAAPPDKADPQEEKLKSAALAVATLLHEGKSDEFQKKQLVDRGRYNHYYKEQHKIEIADRGWTEFVSGIKENAVKKTAAIADPKLQFRKVVFGKEGAFKTCEVWAVFKAKPEKPVEGEQVATDKEPTGVLILHFIKIKGKWVVVSLE